MWSRHPNNFELETVQEYVKSLVLDKVPIDTLYLFIDLDSSEENIEIVHYPEISIQALSNELECTPTEAVWCCVNFPGLLNDIREIQYWNDIGDYKKYIVTTKSHNELGDLFFHDATLFSVSQESARKEFESMGFDVHKIIDVDA